MEKKTNVPKLRFPEFEGEWVEKKLGEALTIGSGRDYKHLSLGNVPVFGTGGLMCYVDDFLYEGETVCIGRKGTIDKPMYFDGKIWTVDTLFYTHSFIKTSPKFIYCIFQRINWKEYNEASGVPSLSKSTIEKINITIPSLSEQTKIASFLTAVDDKLTQQKKKKSLLEEYKKGVMQKIFSQELRFKDDNGEDFPEWEEKNGNLIFESVSDKKHNSDLPILAITQEYGAIPRDLIDYNISVTDKSVESYKVVQKGDFIISLRSFQGGIEYSNYKGICSPAYIILRPIVKIDDRFYKFFFKTESYIKSLNKNLEGIRDGKMISFKYFSEIYLPVPSLPEQIKIANFLSAIDEKINHCSKQIERMEDWKKGLLQQMFC